MKLWRTAGVVAVMVAAWARGEGTRVLVLDEATGKPLPGAWVAVRDIGAAIGSSGSVATDGGGRASVDAGEWPDKRLEVGADGYGTWVMLWRGAAPVEQEVRLRKAKAGRVKVVKPGGEPAVRAEVVVKGRFYGPPPFGAEYSTVVELGRGVTDAAGEMAVAEVRGAFPMKIVATLKGERELAGETYTMEQAAVVKEGLEVKLLEQPLPAEVVIPPIPGTPEAGESMARIRLKVLDDATGEPIERVRVTPGWKTAPDQFGLAVAPARQVQVGRSAGWAMKSPAYGMYLRVEAEGYATNATRLVKQEEGDVSLEMRLKKAAPTTVTLVTADEKPAAGAKVYVVTPTSALSVDVEKESVWEGKDPYLVADGKGQVQVPAQGEPFRLAVVHEAGFEEMSGAKLKLPKVHLQRWGNVEVKVGREGEEISPWWVDWQTGYSTDDECPINFYVRRRGEGHSMMLNRAVSGRGLIGRFQSSGGKLALSEFASFRVKAQPEAVVKVEIGDGHGRLVGTLNEFPGARWSIVEVERLGPPVALPAKEKLTEKEMAAFEKSLPEETSDGIVRPRELRPRMVGGGKFELDGLWPGVYVLRGWPDARGEGVSGPLPTLKKFFLVPNGDSPAVVDVGAVGTAGKPGEETDLAVGSEVPPLVGKDEQGKAFDLKSLRGKWVLMDFWGTWCGFCIAEHPNLQDAQEGWAADGRLALVSVSVGDTPEQVAEYVKKHGVVWQQVVLGNRKETKVPDAWKVDGYPTILLISPEGKVVETGLRGGGIRAALVKHVGKPTPPKATSRP